MRLALVAILAAPLAAAIPGVPEPGPANGLPAVSLTNQNDMFATGLDNFDDFRTAGMDLQVCGHDWVGSASWSMLTDRASSTRSDQAVFLLGRQATGWWGDWHAAGWAGAGTQLDQRLAGQEAQNFIHDHLVHASEVRFPYDQSRGTRGALGGSAAAGWFQPRYGLELVASGLLVGDGERLAEIGQRLSLITGGGALWIGPRWRFRGGDAGGATALRTLEHEDGPWIDLGAWVGPGESGGEHVGYQGHVGYDPVTHASTGSVGLVCFPVVDRAGERGQAIEHELSIYSGGGLGVQVRYDDLPADREWAFVPVVLDYRYGTDPHGRMVWDLGGGGVVKADQRHDQFTGGSELLWRSRPCLNVRTVVSAQAAGGVRSEGVVAETDGAHHLEGRATTGVVRGAIALRFEVGRIFNLGTSLDGWLPWWGSSLTTNDGRDHALNEPGWAWGVHLGGRMAW